MEQSGEAGAQSLRAGAKHYTAYVGPPHQYDFMGATQFRLLCALGLRDHHRLLDFGCGSLRAGRLLISYLQPDRYFGIEPNEWLIDDAIAHQIGADMLRIKRPRFSHSDSFTASVFDQSFDYIVAQSIFSHAGPTLVGRVLASFAERLAPDGICAVTFSMGGQLHAGRGLEISRLREVRSADGSFADRQCGPLGNADTLVPSATGMVSARQGSGALPSPRESRLLNGVVLRSPELRFGVAGALQLERSNPAMPGSGERAGIRTTV